MISLNKNYNNKSFIKQKILKKDNLKISVLASGSTGNVTYIESEKEKLLIDAGLSGKKIEELLNQIGHSLSEIDGLLITHEHNDHSHGAGVISRKYDIPIYANKDTWNAMGKLIGNIKLQNKCDFENNSLKTIGDIDIESFRVSHDAVNPQFYAIHYNNKTFVIISDTGYISDCVQGVIKNADGYLFECNHDLEMLRSGQYPWSLKRRIMSDTGHLSNIDAANYLSKLIGNKTKNIFLGHLSQNNNQKDLAKITVSSILKEHDFNVDNDFILRNTDFDKPTDIMDI